MAESDLGKQVIVDQPVLFSWNRSADANTTLSRAGAFAPSYSWTTVIAQSLGDDVGDHRLLLARAGLPHREARPVYYMKVVADQGSGASSVTNDVRALAEQYFETMDAQLAELEAMTTDQDPPVEAGAVETAKEIARQIREYPMVPPQLSWHGGDAVVMLWAFSTITYALTITAGEVGYVVRKNREQIAMRDSIRLTEFKLLEEK